MEIGQRLCLSLNRKQTTVGGRPRCFRTVRSDRGKKYKGVAADLARVTATSRVTGSADERTKPSNPNTRIGRSATPQTMAGLRSDVRLSG